MASTEIIDCTTCKYGYEDERLGIPMCHHPKRFSEDCVDFNMHEEKEIKESEKPTNLGERIGSYDIVPYIDDKIAKLQDMWREEKVAFDWDDMHEMIEDVASHFAQWGAEHLADARKTSPEDLEEAAIKYFDDNCYLGEVGFECDAVEAFIAGAKWQAEQLKK